MFVPSKFARCILFEPKSVQYILFWAAIGGSDVVCVCSTVILVAAEQLF